MSNDGGPQGAFPKRQLRYAFQHVILPEAAFLNHPALIDQLGRSMPLVLYRSKALIHCEMAGLLQFDETDGDAVVEMMRLFEPMTVDTYAQNGYTAYVVTMPPPEFPADAFFIAMVYKDDEPKTHGTTSPSTRYFTLEKSSLSEEPFLCEWKSNRAHLNYDVGPPAEVAPFVEAVFKRVIN